MYTGLLVVASDEITVYSIKRLETQSPNYAVKEVQGPKVYVQENITTITLLSTPGI